MAWFPTSLGVSSSCWLRSCLKGNHSWYLDIPRWRRYPNKTVCVKTSAVVTGLFRQLTLQSSFFPGSKLPVPFCVWHHSFLKMYFPLIPWEFSCLLMVHFYYTHSPFSSSQRSLPAITEAWKVICLSIWPHSLPTLDRRDLTWIFRGAMSSSHPDSSAVPMWLTLLDIFFGHQMSQ